MSTDNAPLPEAVREQPGFCLAQEWHRDGRGLWAMRSCIYYRDHDARAHAFCPWKYNVQPPDAEAAVQQERARLADIFNTTETDVWRAHEVRDFLFSQNMAHPPPTPEDQ